MYKRQDQESIYDFGVNLGTAFQLQDDYLDSFGGEDFGKRIGGDILEAKKTFLFLKTLEKADVKDRESIMNCYGKPLHVNGDISTIDESLAAERISKVQELYKKYRADQLILEEIQDYTNKALQSIEDLSIDESAKEPLRTFSNFLMNRKV